MKITVMDTLCSLLQTMNTGNGNAWTDASRLGYEMALEGIGDDLLFKVTRSTVKTFKWRPAPSELLEMAAKIASPFPSVDDAYAEMMRKAEREGTYALRSKDDPNVYFEGSPEFTHPLLEKAVRACGGWRSICNGESQMQEGLSKQFRGAYQRYSEEWVGDVANVLSLPEEKRPQKLFPKYVPDEEPNWLLTLANPVDAPKQITGNPEVTPEFKDRVMKLIGKIGN